MDGIKSAIEVLNGSGVNAVRELQKFSFGTIEECKDLFKNTLSETDKSITNLTWLPEFDNVVAWMHDNNGKGLCLRGDCGRGKSSILLGVIPVIFMMKYNKVVKVTHAEDLPREINKLLRKKIIAIDDIGTEAMINDYGEKSEAFNRLINLAEKELRLLFVTTNLGKDDILTRYGNRTWERLNRLCYVINFKGESLRN